MLKLNLKTSLKFKKLLTKTCFFTTEKSNKPMSANYPEYAKNLYNSLIYCTTNKSAKNV